MDEDLFDSIKYGIWDFPLDELDYAHEEDPQD